MIKTKCLFMNGDIVVIKYDEDCVVTGTVEYRAYGFYITTNSDDWEMDNYEELEVIGNKFDNPDLLGE